MSGKTALLVGSTGLIGSQVLQLLLEGQSYTRVIAITRRELPIENDKLEQIITEFDQLSTHEDQMKADDVYCCLGTTMKKAGSNEQFFKVDHEYPLKVAEICYAQGAQQYLLVSALGASEGSNIYYNQVKGQVENAIAAVGFPTLHIFRPSLLLGPRDEARTGEDAAKSFFKVFGFLFVGPLKKYRAIDASKVAQAMVKLAPEGKLGEYIHESADLQEY